MADTSGQADIRGIDVDKLVKGFAEQDIIFKNLVTVTPTAAREIRWFQKTAGFLDSTDTTGITASQIANTAERARPVVVEQSWTRNTSYVRKYFVESPLISEEDIKDSDIDIISGNLKDLTRAVANQVDIRIWNVLSESQSAVNINTTASTAAWDAASGQNPIEDLAECIQEIQENNFTPDTLFLSPKDHKSLIVYIYNQGAQSPSTSDSKLGDGVITRILGLRVVVNNAVTADYAVVANPKEAVTWKAFMPITARVIVDEGIGRKIRVWEEGEAILTAPKSVSLLTNTQT